ncbi:MAG TPA: DUF2164 domain-containing protein [Gemmatimonadaceae bacterium]|jgi:uncharacterized protein (DUF2164 family)|nr:DUF2164 domain-containing protein [Gemmatimonadaceae bacterium]
MVVALPDDVAKRALASIQRYAGEHLDEEFGELQARLLLEFFLKEIAPSVYNAAIADAQTYMRDRVADLEGACYAAEFGYWPKATTRKPR